jgi:2-polyprenyl-3-methyl-5-hydroxy-6-metoxy-1,4-benzoquinol methylase
MENQKNDIHYFYQNLNDESSRFNVSRAESVEFLTTMRYLEMVCPKNSEILDACAGTGVYAFSLAKLGHKVTAGDLVDYNVFHIRDYQKSNPLLKEIYTGSIIDLSLFADSSFDVVLNLGSFYHLIDEEDRVKSIKESLRVLKPNGIYYMSYLNKYSNYFKFRERMNDNFDTFEEYIDKGYNDKNQIFFATMPEDVEYFMNQFEIEQMYNITTDGLKFVYRDTINLLDDKTFERWLNIHFRSCEIKSLLGYSEHGLYIGRKNK